MGIAKNDNESVGDFHEVVGTGECAEEGGGLHGDVAAGYDDGGIEGKLCERWAVRPTGCESMYTLRS